MPGDVYALVGRGWVAHALVGNYAAKETERGWGMLTRGRRRREEGASLVEFALLMPLLILLVLGIVELGFVLGQNNEVRHAAHEGARLAAVNDANLGDTTCSSIGLGSDVTIDFTDASPAEIGEQASVTVSLPVSSLSGLSLIEVFLPNTLSTTADFRLEQQSTNWDSSNQDRDPGGTPCP